MGEKETPLKVVLDTNVVVSALIFRGRLQRMQTLWREGAFQWLASGAVVQEYMRVLAYSKFGLDPGAYSNAVHKGILPHVAPVIVTRVPPVVEADPSDDVFLACAVAGKADVLVSGDAHLLRLKSHRGIPILPPERFLALHFPEA